MSDFMKALGGAAGDQRGASSSEMSKPNLANSPTGLVARWDRMRSICIKVAEGELRASTAIVAFRILDRMGPMGTSYPGGGRLTTETGQSLSTVRRATARLAELGLIYHIRGGTRGGKRLANIYHLEPIAAPAPTSITGGTGCTGDTTPTVTSERLTKVTGDTAISTSTISSISSSTGSGARLNSRSLIERLHGLWVFNDRDLGQIKELVQERGAAAVERAAAEVLGQDSRGRPVALVSHARRWLRERDLPEGNAPIASSPAFASAPCHVPMHSTPTEQPPERWDGEWSAIRQQGTGGDRDLDELLGGLRPLVIDGQRFLIAANQFIVEELRPHLPAISAAAGTPISVRIG